MKYLILCFFLAGCASKQSHKVNLVKAEAEATRCNEELTKLRKDNFIEMTENEMIRDSENSIRLKDTSSPLNIFPKLRNLHSNNLYINMYRKEVPGCHLFVELNMAKATLSSYDKLSSEKQLTLQKDFFEYLDSKFLYKVTYYMDVAMGITLLDTYSRKVLKHKSHKKIESLRKKFEKDTEFIRKEAKKATLKEHYEYAESLKIQSEIIKLIQELKEN